MDRKTKLPDKDVFLEEYKTMSAAEMAEKYGVTIGRIYQYKSKLTNKQQPQWPNDKEFIKLYIECSNAELMKMLNVTRAQLRYHVEQLGLNIDPAIVRIYGAGKKSTKPGKEKLQELAEQFTAKDIAKIYGVTVNTVYAWYQRAGINILKKFMPDDSLFYTHSTSELTQKYNVSASAVCRYRRKHKLPSINKTKKLPEDNELLQLLQEYSPLEVAMRYDVSTAAITRRLSRMRKAKKE